MKAFRLSAGALIPLIIVALSACASGSGTPAPYQPKGADESRALQLVKAADLIGLRDAEVPVDAQAPGSGSTLPVAALLGGLNALRPPPGFSPKTAGALGFAAMFFSGPTSEELSRTSKILVWMPHEEAATAEDAWRAIDGLVQRELAAVLVDTRLPSGYRVEKEMKSVTSYRPGKTLAPMPYRSDEVTWRIRGGDCDDPKVQCRYRITVPVPPVGRMAPTMLGGYPAWSFVRTQGMTGVASTFVDRRGGHDVPRPVFPDLEVLRKLSARLPGWMAIYVAPHTTSYFDEETGKPALLPYPVVLHAGAPLHFVPGG